MPGDPGRRPFPPTDGARSAQALASIRVFAAFLVAASCGTTTATSSPSASSPPSPDTAAAATGGGGSVRVPAVATATTAPLAGARCAAGAAAGCRCRKPNPGPDGPKETSPPAVGFKRFEIRMSAAGGAASLDVAGLGSFVAAGENESCYYVDVPAGSTHDVVFVAREATRDAGIAPVMRIAEYGPSGPYWYDFMFVVCNRADGRCDRRAAADWSAVVRRYKRGRAEPCGSAVMSHLVWETSGSQSLRDEGLYRDFVVRFTMEVKKFPTQFEPGATECIPK